MGNICSFLCPRSKKKSVQTSYDVHQQTFQMQENIDSMNIDDSSPTVTKDIDLRDGISQQGRESDQKLISNYKQVQEWKSAKQFQKKYIDKKIKSKDQISQEMVSFSMEEQIVQEKDMHHENPSFSSAQVLRQDKQNSYKTAQIQQRKNQQMDIEEPLKQEEKKANPNILKPKAIKKKYNPDDYRYKDQQNQFKVKKVDSIKCQQYNIDACNNSEYFIFDVTANVYIDDTNNCKIYIAPCESTIFVRNCKNLTIIAATKQFRTYECHNCVFSLLCKSQPVIQSSSNLTFVPFQIQQYAGFTKQMESIKLDFWNNHWSEIHNFTKKQGQVHYTLRRHLNEAQMLNWERGFAQAQIQECANVPVPFIRGQYPLQSQSYNKCIILFNKDVSKDDKLMLELVSTHHILKGFKGKPTGFGKDDRVALLLAYTSDIQNKQRLQQSGQLFTEKQQVQKYDNQFFVSFGDERQK